MNCAVAAGFIIGSIVGSAIITAGRRRCSILVQTIAILATVMCMFKNLPLIIIGRFLQGAVSVTATIITGKAITETVPDKLVGQYGMLTNIFINVALMVSFSCGLLLPED